MKPSNVQCEPSGESEQEAAVDLGETRIRDRIISLESDLESLRSEQWEIAQKILVFYCQKFHRPFSITLFHLATLTMNTIASIILSPILNLFL